MAAVANPPLSFELPYRSQRMPVCGRQVVATSHPNAAQVGLAIMEAGGTAVDAAIAVAAALSVVEPTMNGPGGDLFAMVWDGERLHGLNASGRAPRGWTRDRFGGRGAMPRFGWDAVTVPGAVSGWAALHARFGTLPFDTLLAPAIAYAREGFPVLPQTAASWASAAPSYAAFAEFRRVFLPEGRAPVAGTWFRTPELADSLREIARTRGAAMYTGALAQRIAGASRAAAGALNEDDLAAHQSEWVEPIRVEFSGARVCELPPNGQGLATLIALGILQHLPIAAVDPDQPDAVHLQLEAMKLAFADCRAHLAEPCRMRVSVESLLDPARLELLARQIRADRAAPPGSQPRPDHGTVYAALADRAGRMVSLIQSTYLSFGSGVVVPGTGIALHNRGLGFSLDPDHPNVVAPGARPYHTIMPGFVLRDGRALMSFGVMGAHMQPQGHVQLAVRTLVHRQNPQAACDAPRWYLNEQSEVGLEPDFPASVRASLVARGHRVLDSAPQVSFGGAQAIYRLDEGYCAGSDPRKDGQAVGS